MRESCSESRADACRAVGGAVSPGVDGLGLDSSARGNLIFSMASLRRGATGVAKSVVTGLMRGFLAGGDRTFDGFDAGIHWCCRAGGRNIKALLLQRNGERIF